jgi:hypothetical protein
LIRKPTSAKRKTIRWLVKKVGEQLSKILNLKTADYESFKKEFTKNPPAAKDHDGYLFCFIYHG